MSPNVPCTRITGTGCVADWHEKSFAPGGLMPGVCALAGAAPVARPAATSISASALLIPRSANHTRTGRAQAVRGGPLAEREASGSGAPPASAAATSSAIAGPCLKPWPEPPPSSHTPACSGCGAAMKCESGESS